ncbi:hypothetical protein [Corynebacterium tapiri]|uniref:Uncharacterized protein n=1 Tax=Corynebacterium tapiri TaxID=1448266 RepID=A0A5C4U666_9CORY|nr:hypothetical protein [Corynebacterium tapiri]TNL99382.1 hypothetical protein FHE74_03230 [Corynebacterium tapiri]
MLLFADLKGERSENWTTFSIAASGSAFEADTLPDQVQNTILYCSETEGETPTGLIVDKPNAEPEQPTTPAQPTEPAPQQPTQPKPANTTAPSLSSQLSSVLSVSSRS